MNRCSAGFLGVDALLSTGTHYEARSDYTAEAVQVAREGFSPEGFWAKKKLPRG